MRLENLDSFPVKEKLELVAEPVRRAVSLMDSLNIEIAQIDPNLADTKTFCEYYKVPLKSAANCVVVQATRSDKKWFAACVVLATTRTDINGLVRRHLNARRVSFAPMDEALVQTNMEYGGITPIGLPGDWPILIDSAVASSDHVVIGSGIRGSKLVVSGQVLAELPGAVVLENLGRPTVSSSRISMLSIVY